MTLAHSVGSATGFAGCRPETPWAAAHLAQGAPPRGPTRRFAPRFGRATARLKRYRQTPSEAVNAKLEAHFDALFTPRTRYETLNPRLQRLHRHKAEWLRVLARPDVPVHTQDAENDRRDRVKQRPICAGTRGGPVGSRLPV